jgi:hypothetical protein
VVILHALVRGTYWCLLSLKHLHVSVRYALNRPLLSYKQVSFAISWVSFDIYAHLRAFVCVLYAIPSYDTVDSTYTVNSL